MFSVRILKTRLISSKNHVQLSRNLSSKDFFTEENKRQCQKRLQTLSKGPSSDKNIRFLNANQQNSTNIANDKAYAVLVPLLTVNHRPSVLFTLRSPHMKMHRGEVSFPGGAVEPGETMEQSAIREAQEEMGIDPKDVEIWGELPPSLTKNLRHTVTPVIGRLSSHVTPLDLIPHLPEVEEIFTVPLDSLCNPAKVFYTQYRLPKSTGKVRGYSTPVFTAGTHRIWGLTGLILHQTLSVIVPKLYRPALRYTAPIKL